MGFLSFQAHSVVRHQHWTKTRSVLSPLLFLIFINDLIKEFNKSDSGVLVGDVRINNLAFADDIVLIANNEEELPELVPKCKVTCGINGEPRNPRSP